MHASLHHVCVCVSVCVCVCLCVCVCVGVYWVILDHNPASIGLRITYMQA